MGKFEVEGEGTSGSCFLVKTVADALQIWSEYRRRANARSLRVSFLWEDSKATPSMTNSRVPFGGNSLDELLELMDGPVLLAMAGLTYVLLVVAELTYLLLAVAGFI